MRLKELEYGHERELREETIRQEQKRSERIGWFIDIIRIACGTFRDRSGNYIR